MLAWSKSPDGVGRGGAALILLVLDTISSSLLLSTTTTLLSTKLFTTDTDTETHRHTDSHTLRGRVPAHLVLFVFPQRLHVLGHVSSPDTPGPQ